jgi:hypothetical protein
MALAPSPPVVLVEFRLPILEVGAERGELV